MRAAARAKSVGDEGKMMAITAGVKRQSPLWSSLRKNGVKTTQEFLDRADKYIKLEEAIANEGKPSPDSKKNCPKQDNGSKRIGRAAARTITRGRDPKNHQAPTANGRSTSSTSPYSLITLLW